MATAGLRSFESDNEVLEKPQDRKWDGVNIRHVFRNSIIGLTALAASVSPVQSADTEIVSESSITISTSNDPVNHAYSFDFDTRFNRLNPDSQTPTTPENNQVPPIEQIELANDENINLDLNIFKEDILTLVKNIEPDKTPGISLSIYRNGAYVTASDASELTAAEIDILANYEGKFNFYNRLLQKISEVTAESGLSNSHFNLLVPESINFTLNPTGNGISINASFFGNDENQQYINDINCFDANCLEMEWPHLFFPPNPDSDMATNPIIDEAISNLLLLITTNNPAYSSFSYTPQFEAGKANTRYFSELVRKNTANLADSYYPIEDIARSLSDILMTSSPLSSMENTDDLSTIDDQSLKFLAELILLLRGLDGNHNMEESELNAFIEKVKTDPNLQWTYDVCKFINIVPNESAEAVIPEGIQHYAIAVNDTETPNQNYAIIYLRDQNGAPITIDDMESLRILLIISQENPIQLVDISNQITMQEPISGRLDIATAKNAFVQIKLDDSEEPMLVEIPIENLSIEVKTKDNQVKNIPVRFPTNQNN